MIGIKFDKYYQQIYKARKQGIFYSSVLSWGRHHKSERDMTMYWFRHSVKAIIDDYLYDNLKSPNSNPAQPALLTKKTSVDFYFGDNCGQRDDGLVDRWSYATGAGVQSVGLDPRKKRLYQIFPALSKMRHYVKLQAERYCHEKGLSYNCDFTHVSVKVYYNEKATPEHTDITFNHNHTEPKNNNSQMPGTPVVICTLGDLKLLQFNENFVDEDGNKSKGNRAMKFYQKSGTFIFLDPRDEELDNEGRFWSHFSKLVDTKDGCCVALMFRVSNDTQAIDPSTNLDPSADVWGTGVKKGQFEDGYEMWEDSEYKAWYNSQIAVVKDKLHAMLRKYCDSDFTV